MYLKPGCEKEYAKRHAAIWPELVKMIKDSGVCNYSIYWDKDTNILFKCKHRLLLNHFLRQNITPHPILALRILHIIAHALFSF